MMRVTRRHVRAAGAAVTACPAAAFAYNGPDGPPERFTTGQLVDSGHRFFGSVSRGLAQVVEEAGHRWGSPTAISWARKRPAPSWAACATAKA